MYEQFGKIFREKYFVKQVNGKHFMRKYQGFGVSLKVLNELKEKGVKYVLHVYTKVNGGKEHWLSTIKQYFESDLKHTFNENDEQRFVSQKNSVMINPEEHFGGTEDEKKKNDGTLNAYMG